MLPDSLKDSPILFSCELTGTVTVAHVAAFLSYSSKPSAVLGGVTTSCYIHLLHFFLAAGQSYYGTCFVCMVARSSLTTTSQDISAIGLLNRRKLAKDSRHTEASLKSDKLSELCASLTSASSISHITRDFFIAGLAKDLFNPSLTHKVTVHPVL